MKKTHNHLHKKSIYSTLCHGFPSSQKNGNGKLTHALSVPPSLSGFLIDLSMPFQKISLATNFHGWEGAPGVMTTMAWEREERLFMRVEATARTTLPWLGGRAGPGRVHNPARNCTSNAHACTRPERKMWLHVVVGRVAAGGCSQTTLNAVRSASRSFGDAASS